MTTENNNPKKIINITQAISKYNTSYHTIKKLINKKLINHYIIRNRSTSVICEDELVDSIINNKDMFKKKSHKKANDFLNN